MIYFETHNHVDCSVSCTSVGSEHVHQKGKKKLTLSISGQFISSPPQLSHPTLASGNKFALLCPNYKFDVLLSTSPTNLNHFL